MTKQVLFIQGAGEGAYQEDKALAANLQSKLSSEYKVHFPEMIDEDNADYDTWASQIRDQLQKLHPVVVVGHSVGASTVIKFLTENNFNTTVIGIFLIAAPFWGGDKGWKYDGYETLVLPEESDTKLSTDVPVFFYHGDKDEVVPFDHLSLYSKRFPKARVSVLKGRGHQLGNDLSEVAAHIKELRGN